MGPDVQTNSLIPAVYLHIPFCLTRCGYCSFYSVPYTKPQMESYYQYLCREIDHFTKTYNITPETIYFGGGTPSLLTADQITVIIDLLSPASDAEITLEANPIQLTNDWLKALSQTKVNRLSLGVQSMHDAALRALGRKHTAESMYGRIRLCREAGFDNISLDLMYGLPGSTVEQIQTDLEEYLKLNPEHISTYLLNIEDDAPFRHWKDDLPDDELAEKQYYTIREVLTQSGYEQYELSNFSKSGKHSRHNLHYWMGDSYLGLGPGASGYTNGIRYHRPDDLLIWKQSVDNGDIMLAVEAETLTQQKADFIIMQLRLMCGLDTEEYKIRFNSVFGVDYQFEIAKLIQSGYLLSDGRYFKLSDSALFISNSIFREFV